VSHGFVLGPGFISRIKAVFLVQGRKNDFVVVNFPRIVSLTGAQPSSLAVTAQPP
jgi:hypothetical protein